MGLDLNSVQFLLRARKQGVCFGSVLTIGRLKLDVFPGKMRQLLQQHHLPDEPFREEGNLGGFAEEFFHCLGARTVQSLDASPYEGAALVHDLNQPIPNDWKERFDVVCDGGTLEHVFNFPVALRNCMELVKVQGYLFLDSPGNNWFGHGFYQFSPELFYQALSEENGYEVVDMIAHAAGPQARWYKVADPRILRSRVELISYTLIHLLVQARRKEVVELFRRMPQQSDYSTMWDAAASSKRSDEKGPNALIRTVNRFSPGLAHLLKAAATGWKLYRSHSLRNRRFFTPIPRE
jgi:SAM-dependent methyltransferase